MTLRITPPSATILAWPTDPLALLELAGRVSWKSEERIAPGTAERFVGKIIERHHESVLEHVSATVRFICSRGVSHELVRHRFLSPTQESTRYVRYACLEVIEPHWWNEKPERRDHWIMALGNANAVYSNAIGSGWKPEDARDLLPHATKTELVCTANFREWRHVFRLRCARDAHPDMRRIMLPLAREFASRCPVVFGEGER